jgi:hypothetical protein
VSFWDRLHDAIEREGETFTLAGNQYHGMIQILDSGRLRAYMDDIEIAGLSKPVLLLTVASDVPLTVGATITRDSRSFTIERIYIHRLRNNQCIKTAVLG